MQPYEINDKGTIDKIVGEKFKIEGRSPVHIEGKLSFPQDAFKLIDIITKPVRSIGGRNPVVYTLQPLKPGTYEIEYQRFEPPWEDNAGQVFQADLYHIVVSSKD